MKFTQEELKEIRSNALSALNTCLLNGDMAGAKVAWDMLLEMEITQ